MVWGAVPSIKAVFKAGIKSPSRELDPKNNGGIRGQNHARRVLRRSALMKVDFPVPRDRLLDYKGGLDRDQPP